MYSDEEDRISYSDDDLGSQPDFDTCSIKTADYDFVLGKRPVSEVEPDLNNLQGGLPTGGVEILEWLRETGVSADTTKNIYHDVSDERYYVLAKSALVVDRGFKNSMYVPNSQKIVGKIYFKPDSQQWVHDGATIYLQEQIQRYVIYDSRDDKKPEEDREIAAIVEPFLRSYVRNEPGAWQKWGDPGVKHRLAPKVWQESEGEEDYDSDDDERPWYERKRQRSTGSRSKGARKVTSQRQLDTILEQLERNDGSTIDVLCLHDGHGDKAVLKDLGFDASDIQELDTSWVAEYLGLRPGRGDLPSLTDLFNDLGRDAARNLEWHAHNAGNDAAVTTICALLLLQIALKEAGKSHTLDPKAPRIRLVGFDQEGGQEREGQHGIPGTDYICEVGICSMDFSKLPEPLDLSLDPSVLIPKLHSLITQQDRPQRSRQIIIDENKHRYDAWMKMWMWRKAQRPVTRRKFKLPYAKNSEIDTLTGRPWRLVKEADPQKRFDFGKLEYQKEGRIAEILRDEVFTTKGDRTASDTLDLKDDTAYPALPAKETAAMPSTSRPSPIPIPVALVGSPQVAGTLPQSHTETRMTVPGSPPSQPIVKVAPPPEPLVTMPANQKPKKYAMKYTEGLQYNDVGEIMMSDAPANVDYNDQRSITHKDADSDMHDVADMETRPIESLETNTRCKHLPLKNPETTLLRSVLLEGCRCNLCGMALAAGGEAHRCVNCADWFCLAHDFKPRSRGGHRTHLRMRQASGKVRQQLPKFTRKLDIRDYMPKCDARKGGLTDAAEEFLRWAEDKWDSLAPELQDHPPGHVKAEVRQRWEETVRPETNVQGQPSAHLPEVLQHIASQPALPSFDHNENERRRYEQRAPAYDQHNAFARPQTLQNHFMLPAPSPQTQMPYGMRPLQSPMAFDPHVVHPQQQLPMAFNQNIVHSQQPPATTVINNYHYYNYGPAAFGFNNGDQGYAPPGSNAQQPGNGNNFYQAQYPRRYNGNGSGGPS